MISINENFTTTKVMEVLDQFTIEKEIKNTDVDIQPDTISTSQASQDSHASKNSDPNRDYLPSCNNCYK